MAYSRLFYSVVFTAAHSKLRYNQLRYFSTVENINFHHGKSITKRLKVIRMIVTHQVLAKSFRGFNEALSEFKTSQEMRHSYILKAKEAGDMLLRAQEVFKEEGHGPSNPLMINGKAYPTFGKIIDNFAEVFEVLVGEIDPDLKEDYFKGSHVNKCMSLARRWANTEYLSDLFTFKHTYRLSKTLDIFKWVEKKLEQDPNLAPGSLSCAQYWQEQEEAKEQRRLEKEGQPTFKELLEEVNNLRIVVEARQEEVEMYKRRAESLEVENAALKQKLRESQFSPMSNLKDIIHPAFVGTK